MNSNYPFSNLTREDGMLVSMQELLTSSDCHKLMAAEGFLVALGCDFAKPDLNATRYCTDFQRTIEFWRIGYETLGQEEQARCIRLLLNIVSKFGKAGYFAKQCVYTTEDNMRGAYVLFLSSHADAPHECMVPKRFRDLAAQGFVAGNRARYSGGRNYTLSEIGQLVKTMREYEQWDRKHLAQESGTDEDTIAHIESGSKVGPEILHAVAQALKLPRRYFFDAKTNAAGDHGKDSPRLPQPEPPRSAPVEQNQSVRPKTIRQCREFAQKARRLLLPSTGATEGAASENRTQPTSNSATEKFMPVQVHDLLTVKDCQELMTAEGYSSLTVYTEAAKRSVDFAKQAMNFKGTFSVWRRVYDAMEPDLQEHLCQQLLSILADLAKFDYVVKYSVYTTEDGKRGGVILLCPKQMTYTKPVMVSRYFSGLIAVDSNSNDTVPVVNYPKPQLAVLPKENDGRKGTYRSASLREIRRAVLYLRQGRGWTRRELAEAASLREYTIERIERCERVADESLQQIAKVFGLPEDAFHRKIVYLASPEEQEKELSKAMANTMPLLPHDLRTVEDCHSILAAYGYGFENTEIPEEQYGHFQHVIDTVKRWSPTYLELLQPEQEEACYALLWAVRQLEAKGFIGQYVTSLTDDELTYCAIRFVSITEKGTKGKEPFQVPRHARKLLDSFRDRDAS